MENGAQDRQEVEWIKRAQHGEQEAFGLLVEQYHRKVFSTVFRIIRQQDQVEDLAQEVFLKVFLAIRSYNFRAPFRAWLSRITINHCYDFLRRQKSSKVSYYWQFTDEGRRALESSPALEDRRRLNVEEESTLKDLVRKLLDRAPPEDRLVLVMKEMEDLSIEEIARNLNWSTSKVKVRLHRARKRMLADYERRR